MVRCVLYVVLQKTFKSLTQYLMEDLIVTMRQLAQVTSIMHIKSPMIKRLWTLLYKCTVVIITEALQCTFLPKSTIAPNDDRVRDN